MLFLFVGLSISNAQEVTFTSVTAPTPTSGAANGGFFWGDMNGDGLLDVFIPSNNIVLNNGATFAAAAPAMTANITLNANGVGGLLADFNGDGVLDLFTTNGGTPSAGLFYNTAGVLTAATGTGDLANTGVTGEVFQGVATAPIDHSNYLSLVWPGTFTNIASNNPAPAGGAMWLLKGGASGFTNIAKGATAANLGIDTSFSFESWDVRFFDANNDGYQDLLMPSFRNLISQIDTGSSGARKGCVLFVNNGAGKFIVPGTASLGRQIYCIDTAGTFVPKVLKGYLGNDSITIFRDSLYRVASTKADTGIIVDDTVRHFAAIGEQWGDLNNDGFQDLVLNGLNATDNYNGLGTFVADIILYGKGDGTFTYKWNGVSVVANNGVTQATNQRAISIGDYNNDGLQDIYASGTFAAQHLYRNNGDGTFTEVATQDALTAGGQRAGQLVDYNNDGFLDVYMFTGSNTILQKNNGNTNKWIGFTPIGTGNNISAIGARFTIWYAGTKMAIRDIHAEGGSAGQGEGLRALFGLGTGTVDSMQVQWPDGTIQKWIRTQLSASGAVTVEGKYWTIKQGAIVPAAVVKTRPSWAAGDTVLTPFDTLRWNSAAGGTGAVTYQAQVATASSFATVLKDVTGLTATTTIVRLGLSTKYYWRVRAISAGFTGVWSAVDSMRTKVIACTTVPTQLYPTSNQLGLPAKPTLKVKYVAEASTYHMQVDTLNKYFTRDTTTVVANKSAGLVLNDSVNVLDTALTMNALKPGVKYFWRVRGWNPAGNSSFSPVDSFTIMYLPATPVLASPNTNQANVRPDTLLMKWRRVAGDSNYVIQLLTYNSAGAVVRNDTTKKDSSFKYISLLNRTRYYWKVMAFNQGGPGTFSALDSFTTAIEVPVAPVIVTPKNVDNVAKNPLFTWKPAVNATKYHMQVASSNDFTVPANIVLNRTTEDTTLQIATKDTLKALTTYYWRIAAQNIGGEGVFSGAAFFTTGTDYILGVDKKNIDIPKVFALLQNYPNPFNPSTTIAYDVPKNAYVTITVYDVLGRIVAQLADGSHSANRYSVQWNASNLSSGMYIYRMVSKNDDGSGTFTAVKKLLLMK